MRARRAKLATGGDHFVPHPQASRRMGQRPRNEETPTLRALRPSALRARPPPFRGGGRGCDGYLILQARADLAGDGSDTEWAVITTLVA